MKRIIHTFLVISLAAVLLSGCGNDNSDTIKETVSDISTETEASEGVESSESSEESSKPESTEEAQQAEPVETAEAESTEVIEDVFVEESQTEDVIAEEQEAPAYTYTDLSKTMFAQESVNIRDLPSTDGNKLGALALNEEVTVTGQCNETLWYRIDYNGGTAYVSNKYIVAEKVEETQQDIPTTQQTVSKGNWADGYELHTWYDMGEYFFYIGTDLDDAMLNGLNPQSIFDSTGQCDPNTYGGILQARYPDRMITFCSTGSIPGKSGVMVCAVNQKSNGGPDWDSVDWLWDSWD